MLYIILDSFIYIMGLHFSVVEFTRGEDAATAVKELDDYEILGRKLKVREVCI